MSKANIQEKTLSIRISTNGFCFCTYLPSEPESLRYYNFPTDSERSIASNLQTAIESCPLIVRNEKYNVKAIIETDEYTMIPTEFDDKSNYREFFRTCFPNSNSNEIVANKLNTQGHTMLFAVEKSVHETVQQLGDVTYYTPASIIIGYLNYRPMNEEQYILAYLYNDLAFFVSMKDNKVQISNIFRKEETENTLFYLLSIWKEQKLSQEQDVLYVCGDRSIESFIQATGRFIRRVERINPNALFPPTLLNKIQGIPFDLQALILCE